MDVLYIEPFFFYNFIMDGFLVGTLSLVNHTKIKWYRCLASAFVGASGSVLMVIFIQYDWVCILGNILLCGAMVRVAWSGLLLKLMIKRGLQLYMLCIIGGGMILACMRNHISNLKPIEAISIMGMICILLCGYMYIKRYRDCTATVWLTYHQNKIRVTGLIDTGNNLYVQNTYPVSILGKKEAVLLLRNEKLTKMQYIPFSSIGGEGMLLVIQIDEMRIVNEKGKETKLEKPWIGINEAKISRQVDYQIILHKELGG